MAALWWIGLIGSWLAILAVLKLVLITLRVLKHIRRLTELNAQTAAGLAENIAAEPMLAAVAEVGGELGQAATTLASRAAAVERTVESLSPTAGARRS
ncbi:MAG: hypothetical protein KY462_06005 [Actinobacteria bacterium]|nr:hypothetical protein [Actinomycetota bacterium]